MLYKIKKNKQQIISEIESEYQKTKECLVHNIQNFEVPAGNNNLVEFYAQKQKYKIRAKITRDFQKRLDKLFERLLFVNSKEYDQFVFLLQELPINHILVIFKITLLDVKKVLDGNEHKKNALFNVILRDEHEHCILFAK